MSRQMKDSGIEWIGEIPENWLVSRLKNIKSDDVYAIVDGPFGTAISTSDYVDSGVPLVRILNLGNPNVNSTNLMFITEEHAMTIQRSKFGLGDIIFAKTGATVGKCAINDSIEYGILSSSCVKISISDSHFNKYFYYLFNTNQFNMALRNSCNGTTRDTINLHPFSCLACCVPSLQEQKIISAYLDRQCSLIDSVIEKTKESIEEYKKLKQSVITEAVTKGVRGDRTMKDSGIEWIGEIPQEWEVIPSKFLFKNSDERKRENDIQLTASQKHGIISQIDYMRLEQAKIVFANKGLEDWKHVEPFDFIISLRSFQGGLEMSETSGCITWHYIVLKNCKPICHKYYKWLFKSSAYIKALQRTCQYIRDGQDLRYSNFVQVPLCIFSVEEQQEIADYLDQKCSEIDTLITKKEQFLTELESYKKSMIYEYVTGKKEAPQV